MAAVAAGLAQVGRNQRNAAQHLLDLTTDVHDPALPAAATRPADGRDPQDAKTAN